MTGDNKLKRVIAVFKTHFDLGFTDLPDRVMSLYTGPMFSAARETISATAREPEGLRYTWTLPAWPLKQLLHDPVLPAETREEARELVRQGRLRWHAWPFTTHTAFCGLEDLVRGLHISRSLSEEFGIWPGAAKQTDVPGHTWILPTLLTQAGVRFLHLGCNSGSHAPHVPRLFWWEGPDSSRILTYYSVGGYGTSLLPPEDWTYDTWLALQHTEDNVGPHSPEDLLRMRREFERDAPPGVELVFGGLDDFADALLAQPEQLEDLPVVPYDLADTWIHGIGTMPREVARVRALRPKLLELEGIAALVGWPSGNGQEGTTSEFVLARQIAPLIDEAYLQLMLFGEHTWGLDIKNTIIRAFGEEFAAARETEPYRRLEESWQVKADYVTKAEEAYARAYDLVYAPWQLSAAEEERQRKFDSQLAQGIQAYKILREDQITNDIGPRLAAASERSNIIETDNYYIEVDPAAGSLLSLLDKRTGRDWVDRSSSEPFGGIRYDLYSAGDIAEFMRAYGRLFQDWFVQDFGKAGYPEHQPHITAYARNFTLQRENNSYEGSFILTGGTLEATSPGIGQVQLPAQRIDIKINVSGSNPITIEYMFKCKKATHLAESIVVPFPLHMSKPAFRLGQVGSVIDPARDIAEGANHYLWCVDRWLDATDDRMGLAILPIDMPLVSIGDVGIYKFEPRRFPTEPLVYVHLSNTQWGTNFPQWLEGDFSYKLDLLPHGGDWREGELWKQDISTGNHELRMGDVRRVGVLPLDMRLARGLNLQSLRPRHNGEGVIMRFWDALGTHRPVALGISGPVKGVWRCDLMERPVELLQMKCTKGSDVEQAVTHVRWTTTPHAIETLLIEFDR